MNWKMCSDLIAWAGGSRFDWPIGPGKLGFDCNPDKFTISDVWGAISWVWTYPGDYLLSLPDVRSFFELGSGPIVGNVWSTVFGWFMLLIIIAAMSDV